MRAHDSTALTTRAAPGLREPSGLGRTTFYRTVPPLDPQTRERLQRREPAALEVFVELYADRVYGYVRGLVNDEHLAEDLTQDVFANVQRRLAHYDPSRELAPWVFTIATNKVRDYWRSRRHQDSRHETSIDSDDTLFELPDRGERPEAGALLDELSREVREAVEGLPEGMRQTVLLRVFEGLSFEAIGLALDRSEVAVRKRYSRALAALREVLEPNMLDAIMAA